MFSKTSESTPGKSDKRVKSTDVIVNMHPKLKMQVNFKLFL